MKILFYSKDPKICALMHTNEEVITKIPQYCRLLAKSFIVKHNCHMFNLQVQIEKIDKREPTMEWVLDRISHRSYLFNLIKNMIKEYDLRFNNGRFLTERSIIAEIGCWGSMENIDWSFTGLK